MCILTSTIPDICLILILKCRLSWWGSESIWIITCPHKDSYTTHTLSHTHIKQTLQTAVAALLFFDKGHWTHITPADNQTCQTLTVSQVKPLIVVNISGSVCVIQHGSVTLPTTVERSGVAMWLQFKQTFQKRGTWCSQFTRELVFIGVLRWLDQRSNRTTRLVTG